MSRIISRLQPRLLRTGTTGWRRAGFSILEAIIVLAITSLALVLVFSIGQRATQTGFRLANRALGVADARIGSESVRAALQALMLPPPHSQGLVLPDVDGGPYGMTGGASFPRATACAEAGPSGSVVLKIARDRMGARLTCATSLDAPGLPPRVLADLGGGVAAFSYSQDGVTWLDRVHVPGAALAGGDPRLVFSETRRLWVRLADANGRFEVIEVLSSGRPPPPRPEAGGIS